MELRSCCFIAQIPSRSFTQVRQFYYRETKKIQNLLGEAQSLVDWSDKDVAIRSASHR